MRATVGECQTTDLAQVTVVAPMDLGIAVNPLGGQAPLNVTFTPSGNNLVSYSWNFGDEGTTADTSNQMSPSYLYAVQGMYTPMLTATDNLGCTASTTFEFVRVSTGIPNIFTPNGDGQNDEFNIGVLPANTTVRVFNRWGKMVFESKNYDNSWNGGELADGIYYYQVNYPDSKEDFKGWIELHR
ncbi:MAG: T9SS type B sorting domain-containing protein [Sphingobacteriales bacterium]|nr:MAG: T9SS type B sorting domain-containing protein [Sphingobacteriales bacterium]